MKFVAAITITLRPVVNDPQGLAILGGLHNLGFEAVEAVRSGKYFEVTLDVADRTIASTEAARMCEQLLANPVIENYRFEIREVGGTG